MCLYIGNKKPLVAKKDIVVYKYVESSDGNYKTPFHAFPVKVNALMVAEGGSGDITKENCEKYSIHGGAIHACTSSNDTDFEGNTCLKAIIKKGTEFWVQDDFKQVAARSLYITDEVVEEEETSDLQDIYVAILESVEEHKNGLKVGDVLLADKTYVSPLNEFDHSKAIAVVMGFHPEDDSPIYVATKESYLPLFRHFEGVNSCQSNIKRSEDLKKDFDGYKHTYDIANADDYNADLFKAIEHCINYSTEGTNKGDWHLGAGGEMIMLAQNLTIVNASILLNNIGTPISMLGFWTSSQYRDGQDVYSWYVTLDNGDSIATPTGCSVYGCIRPLLSLKKCKRTYIKRCCNKLLNYVKDNMYVLK